ncbi:cytochrome P450 [Prauserella sp. PE36]|uniref:Cytochrome P450 n=1 Tax=Prauserella endophytica TaxID=1592324 RepID=A0ABY2S861_9PSEU|nr:MULTISPECIES: cytochrome P450 [Prauserella]RBM20098.1 cytochrome P450 [Prauserella sp. PE36]TKG71504.1 cytochrome P450 [Prauserella endophytica]
MDFGTRLGDDFVQDPHRIGRLLREEGPVRQVTLRRGLPAWLVTSYAEARSLLADPRLAKDASKRPQLFPRAATGDEPSPFSRMIAAHLLNSDPPDHTRLRRLVAKAFTGRTVARLRPRIEQIADELLDDLAGSAEVDLVESYAFPLPITVICELLGVPSEDRDRFRAWSATLISPADADELGRASHELAAYLITLLDRKREAPADDLLSDLVHTSDEGDQLSQAELVSMAFLLLVAGHETTVSLIANGVLALLREPDQLAALRADPSLLPGAVEEFLRFDGPINLATLRYTTEPVRVGDVELPENAFVLVSLLAANRDEARFPDPDRLDITRSANGHLAFGHGIHYCVGAPLARLEGEIAIGRLLHRFGDLRLAGAEDGLRWRDSTLVHALESLRVRLS